MTYNEELLEDPVIERHLTPLFERSVERKVTQMLSESIELPLETLISELSLIREKSKNLIDRMILDGKIRYFGGNVYEASSFGEL